MKKRIDLFIFLFILPILSYAQKSESTGWHVEDYTEATAKAYLDRNTYYLDPVEGIWQSSDGYKYAIEKDVENSQRQSDKYRMIVLESSFNGWETSDIKGFITQGSIDGAYSMKYYTRNKDRSGLQSQNVLLFQESSILMSFQRIDQEGKIFLYKLYPKSDIVNNGTNNENTSNAKEAKTWSGSSIVIGHKYLATNYHVVEEAKSIMVCGINGNPNSKYTAEVIASDKYNDLAIVKITDSRFNGFSGIRYGCRTSTIDVGSSIFVLGYPLTSTMGEEIKLTTGVISSKTGFQGDVSQYQISAAVQPGNSGGPLFDSKGYLVGIVSAKHLGAENVGYAIKLSYLKNLIESIDERILLPTTSALTTNSLSEQVKAISPYVLRIEASNSTTSFNSNVVGGKASGDCERRNSEIINEAKRYLEASYKKFENGDYIAAYDDACKSVELYPTPDSHYFRGYLALFFAEEFDKAKESFIYCVEKKYRIEDSYVLLGRTFYELKDYHNSIKTYDKVIDINVRNVDALFLRGLCKSEIGDRIGAINDYKQAIKYEGIIESNYYATMYNNISYSYVTMGDLENAKPYIKEALKRNHTKGFIWDTNGELSYKLGNYNECINSMNNAITIDNKNGNSYLYRGLAKLKLKQMADGYRDLERAKELENKNAEIELSKINASSIDFSNTYTYSNVYTSLEIQSKGDTEIKILGIESTHESTTLFIEWTNTQYDNGYYCIDPNTYICDKSTGQKYTLLASTNCAILPEKTSLEKGMTAKFTLTFPAIPKNCKLIDFIEPDSSSWKFYGIKLK